jgi:ribosomal protein L35
MVENEEMKSSSLLAKRYKPFKGGCKIESDNKKMIITKKECQALQLLLKDIHCQP